MVDLSMQKKILGAATFKGMGDRKFPMWALMNAANQITYQEHTGELLTTDDTGAAMPIKAPQQIAEQTQALNLAGQITELTKAVNALVENNEVVNKRIKVLENTTDEVIHQFEK
tara:strand:- start:87 stop:428 length:342 start_codon:yes stop_codon:yes gene_type:complete